MRYQFALSFHFVLIVSFNLGALESHVCQISNGLMLNYVLFNFYYQSNPFRATKFYLRLVL